MITLVYGVKDALKKRKELTINSFNSIKRLKDVEVIVSDYGSTDNIKEVCKEYGFKYIYTEPDGEFCIAKCYNHGIYKAQGDIIIPVGCDMILDEDVNKGVSFYHEKRDNDFIGLIPLFHWEEKIKRLFPMRSVWRWVPTYKKISAISCGGYDERFVGWGHEDIDFIERLKEKLKIGPLLLPDVLCIHQWHGKEHSDKVELQEGGNPNMRLFDENRETNSKNMVNSYW